jgi:hypothetical protein
VSLFRSENGGVADSIRCPFCGGLNAADAQWCGQCLKRFPEAEPAAAEPQEVAEESAGAPAPAVGGIPGTAGSSRVATGDETDDGDRPAVTVAGTGDVAVQGSAAAGDRPFEVTAEGIKWTCPTCETPNPIETDVCSVCGTTFAQMVHPEPELADKDPNTAALISLFFPGAGHGYLGLWGDAIARGVISAWVILVAIIAAFAGEQASGRLVTILFALIGFALWGIAAHDAYRAARKEKGRVILKGRGFLYLVLSLLGLLLLVLVGSALGARR